VIKLVLSTLKKLGIVYTPVGVCLLPKRSSREIVNMVKNFNRKWGFVQESHYFLTDVDELVTSMFFYQRKSRTR